MGVISKGGIRGGKKRPGRACQHCDIYSYLYNIINSIYAHFNNNYAQTATAHCTQRAADFDRKTSRPG